MGDRNTLEAQTSDLALNTRIPANWGLEIGLLAEVYRNLHYDRHQEEMTIELFEQVIAQAGEEYFLDPSGAQIADWTRALAVMPDLRECLQGAVQQDAIEAKALLLRRPHPVQTLQLT